MSALSKKIASLVLTLTAAVGGTLLLSGGAANAAPNQSQGAFVIKGLICSGSGYQGPFVVTDQSQVVVTPSGNTKLTCHFDGPTVSQTVNDKGFLCGTYLGATYDSHFVYTKSGHGTLTCYLHSS
jgi:hypothetical protein